VLNKNGVRLTIKEASLGAWVGVEGKKGGELTGISIRPDIQYFYVHSENRNEAVLFFWNYKEFVKAIISPLQVNYKQLRPDSVRDLKALHDSLIAAHIQPKIQVLLREQVKAGFREYQAINEGIALSLSNYIYTDVLRYPLAAAMFYFTCRFQIPMGKKVYAGYKELIESPMLNWRGLLSPNGESYPHLNKTIDNWFGPVPRNIQNLREVRLERALNHQNVRLLLGLGEVDKDRHSQEERDALGHLIQIAKPNDISMLLKMPVIGGNRRTGNNPYQGIASYILDGIKIEGNSYKHVRSLSDAWQRSYRAHSEAENRRLIQQRKMDEAQRAGQAAWLATETAPLPFALPEDKGIRFLGTVQDIYEEHRRMKHCIDTYSKDAVLGNCYLFHIDYEGEMASAEVSPQGVVKQIRGPHNVMNKACDYAGTVLKQWVIDWKAAAVKGKASKEKDHAKL